MALEQIHVEGFCILGVQTKFILQNKSMARAIAPPPPASNTVFSPVLDFLANLFSWRFPLSWRCQDILFWRTARPEVSAAPLWKLFFLVAVFLGELLSKEKNYCPCEQWKTRMFSGQLGRSSPLHQGSWILSKMYEKGPPTIFHRLLKRGKRIVLFPWNRNGTETTMMHCNATFDGAMLWTEKLSRTKETQ